MVHDDHEEKMNQLNILYYREGDSSKPSGPCNKKTNSGIMKPQFAWTKSTNYSNTVTIDNHRIDIFTVWVRSFVHTCMQPFVLLAKDNDMFLIR